MNAVDTERGRRGGVARRVIDEHGGHLADPDLVGERFGWLVQPV